MDGHFTIPTRIYLSAEQRAKLERLLRHQERDLAELLSELAAGYIAAQPEPPPDPPADQGGALREELRQRRAQLRRLRPQLHDPHNPPPHWLLQMVADLEAEVARLERELG